MNFNREPTRTILKKRIRGENTPWRTDYSPYVVITLSRKVFSFFGEPETVYETEVKRREGPFLSRDYRVAFLQKYESEGGAREGHRKLVDEVREFPDRFEENIRNPHNVSSTALF